MNQINESKDFIYRKLKITDYNEFKNLFYSCFHRNVSFEFFKERYFNNKLSFCYGIFKSSRLIANVGLVSLILNNKNKEKILSRHSSMVLKKYRNSGLFSNLSKKVISTISKKIRIIAMWPNKNNLSNFSIEKKYIIKKKYFLYKTSLKTTSLKKLPNYNIDELKKFKKFIQSNNSFFLKNFTYFKKRYLLYKKNEYFINKFEKKQLKSFFILKRNKDKSGLNYVVLDHFGSEKIKSIHLKYLIETQDRLIFLSKNKINKTNIKILDFLYFKIGLIKKFTKKQQQSILLNQDIYLGDTDIFITY